MDVPALGALAWVLWFVELADEHTVAQSVQVDIVVLRCSDDELAWLNVLVLNDLDCVDQGLMGYDEDFLDKVLLSRLVVEVNVSDVPDLKLTGRVSCDQGVVVLGNSTGGELIVLRMLTMELELWLVVSYKLIKAPESKPLVCCHR